MDNLIEKLSEDNVELGAYIVAYLAIALLFILANILDLIAVNWLILLSLIIIIPILIFAGLALYFIGHLPGR